MKRIISTRLPEFNLESKHWLQESQNIWNLQSIKEIIVSHVFDFYNLEENQFLEVQEILESEMNTLSFEIPSDNGLHFHIKAVDGQFDDTLSRTQTLINKFGNIDTEVSHSLLFTFPNATKDDVEKFKSYFMNEYEYVDFDAEYVIEDTSDEMEPISNFINFDENELELFKANLAMDIEDLKVLQDYFIQIDRNPSMTEVKIIDTYWSDHCRHTTFFTHLDNLVIKDSRVQAAYNSYLETRKQVYTERIKPITLMDLATINAREINQKGLLNDWDKSDEVNAISLNVDIDVNGESEGWQLLFKNETHNHPTEIEPYGGASTCFGGCVRDPLSGRGMVYQGMRISGSKNPLTTLEDTRKGKLMARRISQEAVEGFSDYSNQIGIKSGYVKEYYHDGYEAKRLELGALVAAVRQDYVQKTEPKAGDAIILLGGKTGRDGLGAAVGSSMTQTKSSLLTAGAEVQKGDPITEHKIVRLFRDPAVLKLIKRCNDFGAGGVSVAVGELADGLIIDLDKVKTKYPLHGGEIALSESQERMAVVIDKDDVETFIQLCYAQDIEASEIATVTEEKVMKMVYNNQEIVSIDRSFLDSNGAVKSINVIIENYAFEEEVIEVNEENLKAAVSNIHTASQKGLREKFNQKVMMGNVHEGNEISQEGMVSLFPVSNTDNVSFMSAGFPLRYSNDPFKLGYLSVVEAISRLTAMGANPTSARLSMQEYFERLVTKEKWGKPYAALLGAFTVMKAWDIPALGGKDSMSGTFEELDVPPTLVTFAVQHGKKADVITRNLKGENHKIVWLKPEEVDGLIDLDALMSKYKAVYAANLNNEIYSASTITDSIFNSLFEMSLASEFGLDIIKHPQLLSPNFGGLLLEVNEEVEFGEVIATVNSEKTINVGELKFSKSALKTVHEEVLESVYPTLKLEEKTITLNDESSTFAIRKNKPVATVIMVEGVNGDFDVKNRLVEAGFIVDEQVIKLMDYENSLTALKDSLLTSDILVLPHGNVKDNGVNMPGVEWKIIFEHEILKDVLNNYKGEIVGIGNGALGLVSLGLLGKISLQPIGKHYYTSDAVITSENHPALIGNLNEVISVPMTIPFAITKFEGSESVLQQTVSPLNVSNTIGLVKNNVIGFLGSIDQIETSIFKNLAKFKMEEII